GDSAGRHYSIPVGLRAASRLRPRITVLVTGEGRSTGPPRRIAKNRAPQRRWRAGRLVPLRIERGWYGRGFAGCGAEEVVRRCARPPLLPWLAQWGDRVIRTTRSQIRAGILRQILLL